MSNWEVHREVFIRKWAKEFFNIDSYDIEDINWCYFTLGSEHFDYLDNTQKIYIDSIDLKVNNFHLDWDELDFKVDGGGCVYGQRVVQIYSYKGSIHLTVTDINGNDWEIY
jgi:hypothetical protein